MDHFNMNSWKRVVGARIRYLTKEQALEIIKRITAEGNTIFHEDIRNLTGGLNSQSINSHVLRKLGYKAGIIKVPA